MMWAAMMLCCSTGPTSQSRIEGTKTVSPNEPFLFIIGLSEVLVTVLESCSIHLPTEIGIRHQEPVGGRIDADTQVF